MTTGTHISTAEYEQQGRISAINATFEAGQAVQAAKQRKKDELDTIQAFETYIQRYAAHTDELPLAHLDRVRSEMLSRNETSINAYAIEVTELAQFALQATNTWKDKQQIAQAKAADLDAELREQIETSKEELEEFELLEKEAAHLRNTSDSQFQELAFLRVSLAIVSFTVVWLACFLTGNFLTTITLSLHLAAAVTSAGFAGLAFIMYNE